MKFVLIYLAGLVGADPAAALAQAPDSISSARRLAATAHLAAEEYRLGVSGGKIIAAAEVEEARLFLAEARRNAARLPAAHSQSVIVALGGLEAMVARTAPPESLAAGVDRLVTDLAGAMNITLDEVPAETPSLARGREIYLASCALCHGQSGRGDGPQAAMLRPAPANLADAVGLAGSSPLDFYRRITVGVAGTTMASFEAALPGRDRWAVALYASTLRLPPAAGTVPDTLADFHRTAVMSDRDIATLLGTGAAGVAALRAAPPRGRATAATDAVFTQVRRQIDSAYDLARAGRGEDARTTAMDAYVTFEQVEMQLRVKDPALTTRIEDAFSSLRTRAGSGATREQLVAIREELARALERAERTLVDRMSAWNLLVQSFVILVREGLEAILLIGALMAFLVRSGNQHRRRDIHVGVGAAVVMSLLTALALETIFVLSPSHQEGLEGGIMMVAAVTLFYVSYWLLSKMEVAKWNRFVKSRMEDALSRRSAFALGSVAFLAVYREGFETVLFYKALAVSGGTGSAAWVPVGAGILAGSVVLAVVYVAINRFGVRLPLKPLFGVTGTLLYYMAFVFVGKGIADLQESGAVSLSPLGWAPRLPAMGIYPTMESLGVQAALVLLALIALGWIFIIEPRRLRVTRVLVPDPAASPPPAPAPKAPPARDEELLRSIDRIETDIAEVRSELERMRGRVNPESSETRRPK